MGLTKRAIDATKPDPSREQRLWDDDPRGFGIRIKPSGAKTFFIQYRSPVDGKKRRYTIDQYGKVTLDQAREKARSLFGRIADGEDPQLEKKRQKEEVLTKARFITDLCDDYMRDAWDGKVRHRGKPKKSSTLQIDEGRIRRHIKPLLGSKFVGEITAPDVNTFFHDVRLGKTAVVEKTGSRGVARVTGGEPTAKRCVDLLGSIFSYAVKNGLRADNPVIGFERPVAKKRDRILNPQEYQRLGSALNDLENEGRNKVVIRAIRLLALTGCRRGEVFGLRKSEVDIHNRCFRFGDTKTGQQIRPFGHSAAEVLSLGEFDEESKFVFPASRGDGHLVDAKMFRLACEKTKLEGVSLHTLRHAFGTVANELDYSELTIGGLLGHSAGSVTARYAHNVDRALVAAADRISAVIAARMDGNERGGADVIPISAARG